MEETYLNLEPGAEDISLWQDFKRGNRLAFDIIYQKHIQHLISYGYKITSNRSLIQDTIQDLFVELWESRERLTDVASIKYYLLKSMRYKLIKNLRTENTEELTESVFENDVSHFEIPMFREEVSAAQSARLFKALGQLPKRQQEAIHLRYFQELSNEEVARLMGVNYQSACKFIYTGLKALREIMQLSGFIPLLFSLFL